MKEQSGAAVAHLGPAKQAAGCAPLRSAAPMRRLSLGKWLSEGVRITTTDAQRGTHIRPPRKA